MLIVLPWAGNEETYKNRHIKDFNKKPAQFPDEQDCMPFHENSCMTITLRKVECAKSSSRTSEKSAGVHINIEGRQN